MNAPSLAASHEASRGPIEIREEDAITIDQAIAIAADLSFALGKSTLQRWAKFWRDRAGGPVRSVLVTTTSGKIYKLSREDFEAWVFDQKQNDRSRETPPDLTRSREASPDLERPHEVSGEATQDTNRIKELESENLQLKIDLGVRKQLLDRAKEEMDGLRSMANTLLRENGALQYQIHQLAPAKNAEPAVASPGVDNSMAINDGATL
jgi:hypothetical protein